MKKFPSLTSDLNHGTLADRVRFARRKAAISQAALARHIGVSASAVAQWERPDGTQPCVQSLIGIVELTGVSLEWLMMGRTNLAVPEGNRLADVPAVMLESFAQSTEEEQWLAVYRSIPVRKRSLLMSLAEAISEPRGSR